MDYDKAVAEGRRLLASTEAGQWKLAKLTYEVLLEPGNSIRKWADSLGVSKSHVGTLKNVWVRYGRVHHDGHLTFNECYAMAGMAPERAARAEREARERRRSVGTVRNQRKPREVAREYLRDRKHARELLRDPEVREIFERELRPARPEKPSRPRRPRSGFAGDMAGITTQLNALLGDVIDVKLSRGERRSLVEAFEEHENTVGWFGDYLRSGDRSFEDVLDRLLEDAGPVEAPPPPVRRRPRAETPPRQPRERRPRREGPSGGRHRVAS